MGTQPEQGVRRNAGRLECCVQGGEEMTGQGGWGIGTSS